MTFPSYPAYKKSGVEWLGEVPAHWEVKPLKYGCSVFPSNVDKKSYEGQKSVFLCNYTDVYYNEKITEGMNFMPASATDEQIEKFSLRAGDVIFTKDSETADDIAIATYVPANICGVICGYHLSIARPKKLIDGNFIKRFFDSHSAKSYFAVSANGLTRVGLSQYSTDKLPVPFPPIVEQTQIACFLDHETGRIDALIEEQQRLIELLKEKRQAVISHAVTKGLDPTVPMKDSGVEWLGEVPAHWVVARVKNVAKLESGHTPSKDFPEYWEGGDIPWVSLNDSKQLKVTDYIEETQFMITEAGVSNSSARILPAQAVVFTRDATIGLAAITTRLMCVSQHLIAWICNENFVLPEYLLLVFYAMEEELDRFTFGATIKTIGMPDIRKLVTPVPPLAEQALIVADVNAKRELIDQLVKESDTALSLHLERRSALISAAVTGKIDVRGWQPPASEPSPKPAQEAM